MLAGQSSIGAKLSIEFMADGPKPSVKTATLIMGERWRYRRKQRPGELLHQRSRANDQGARLYLLSRYACRTFALFLKNSIASQVYGEQVLRFHCHKLSLCVTLTQPSGNGFSKTVGLTRLSSI